MAVVTAEPTYTVDGSNRQKVVDAATGIQAIKGSQRIDEGFLEGVRASYTNVISYHPIALFLFAVGLFVFIAEEGGHDGPLEMAVAALTKYLEEAHHPTWARNIAAVCLALVRFLITWKIAVASVCLILFPVMSKPSTKNWIIALFLFIYSIYSRDLTTGDVFVLSQLHFLFANLRNPAHSAIIFIVFVAIFVFDVLSATGVSVEMGKNGASKLSDLRSKQRGF